MRHTKGSIVLSETQDHPILRQILECGFVTHDQLFRFMQLSLHERSRNSYNNRIRRLVKHHVVVEGNSTLVPGSRYIDTDGDSGDPGRARSAVRRRHHRP